MGLELADQLGWKLPDVIFYPTGGGTGLIGMWKAFQELQQIGWLEQPSSSKLPRMVAVQASGCAPIVKAWQSGKEHADLWENAQTVAAGIRVPVAVGDFLILSEDVRVRLSVCVTLHFLPPFSPYSYRSNT
jgi:threonine synthase